MLTKELAQPTQSHLKDGLRVHGFKPHPCLNRHILIPWDTLNQGCQKALVGKTKPEQASHILQKYSQTNERIISRAVQPLAGS